MYGSYLFYSFVLLLLVICTALFLLRAFWLPHVQAIRDRVCYVRVPTTFLGDAESGLSSANFDLAANITDDQDARSLDAAAKQQILRLMKARRVTFDEARRLYIEERFRKNGIGADGLPNDPKFVSFS